MFPVDRLCWPLLAVVSTKALQNIFRYAEKIFSFSSQVRNLQIETLILASFFKDYCLKKLADTGVHQKLFMEISVNRIA